MSWDDLIAQGQASLSDRESFDARERDYKLAISAALHTTMEAARDGGDWQSLLKKAFTLKTGDQPYNLSYYLQHDWLKRLTPESEEPARRVLASFLDESSPERRFRAYADLAGKFADKQGANSGAVLVVGSILNSAVDPANLPLVKTTVFEHAEKQVGHRFPKGTPTENYMHHLEFARLAEQKFVAAGLDVNDLLDVQSILWEFYPRNQSAAKSGKTASNGEVGGPSTVSSVHSSGQSKEERKAELVANAWFELTRCAGRRETINYAELGSLIGGIHHRQVSPILEVIQRYCRERKPQQLPPLTVLVVNKDTKKPGAGFTAASRNRIEAATRLVYDYDWDAEGTPLGSPTASVLSANPGKTKLSDKPSSGAKSEPSYALVERRIRDTKKTRWVKEQHDYACQVCALQIVTPNRSYVEGCHIVPLGNSHLGEDEVDNILALCPNCHVRFDYGTIVIDENLAVLEWPTGKKISTLRTVSEHQVSPKYLAWHRAHHGGGWSWKR
jgi:hypothetical protein